MPACEEAHATTLVLQGATQVAKNVARILTLADRYARAPATSCMAPSQLAGAALRDRYLSTSPKTYSYKALKRLLVTRLDVPFFEGADEPLLGQAMDASFVRT